MTQVMTSFDEHAQHIAKRQYFQDADKNISEMFRRVAKWVASPEKAEVQQSYMNSFFMI
ncbi:MAG: hypothetical protein R2865_04045 [Deinococcales bacterium]